MALRRDMFRLITLSCLVPLIFCGSSADENLLDEILTIIHEQEVSHDQPSSLEREAENAPNVAVASSMQTKNLEKPSCDREYKDSCYVIVRELLNYEDASNKCQSLGGHLADISDSDENDVIHQLAAELGIAVLIDGQDTAEEGVWRWATSGEIMTYTKWNTGEPNNIDNEDCVFVYENRGGAWNDVPCSVRFYSVCEIEEKPSVCDGTHQTSCYVVVNEALSWKNSQKRCNDMGGHLADITSSAENDVIQQLAAGIGKVVWIDGQDKHDEGVWRWATSRAKMTYTKWNTGEPNDINGEDCVFLYSDRNGAWNDVPCDTMAASVCEIIDQDKCDRTHQCSCYVVVNEALSWENASSKCQEMGGHLADISDQAENDVIHQLAAGIGKVVWIDGQDTRKEGVWRWASRGHKMTYTNWNTGEPNDIDGEDCVFLYSDRNGAWNDVTCNTVAASVCKIKGHCN